MGEASGSLQFNPPFDGCHTNCMGTLILLEEALKAGVKKIIFSTTGSSYADTPVPHKEDNQLNVPNFYTASKIFNEHSIRLYKELYGLDYVILRYASVYGPKENKGPLCNVVSQFYVSMKKGQPPVIYGDGGQTRDFIFVKDVAAANIFAMDSLSNDTFNVGTGIATSFNDVVRTINKVLNTDIKPTYGTYSTPVQKKYVSEQLFDNSKLISKGFRIGYTLEEGIREYGEATNN